MFGGTLNMFSLCIVVMVLSFWPVLLYFMEMLNFIHVKDKGYKTLSKQLHESLTRAACSNKKYKIHGTVVNLPEHGRKNKMQPQP